MSSLERAPLTQISRRGVIAGAIGFSGAALLCQRNPVLAQDSSSGDVITFGISYDTTLFDQLRSGTSPLASSWIFENLVIQDSDGSYHPWVAESWETSDDNLEITFNIRPGITFHDGTDLNADAVKWFFDKASDPNGEHSFSSSYSTVSSIEVVDDLTVKFVFSAPTAGFFATIAGSMAGLISPTAYEEAGDDYGVSVIVGSGPFRLASWTPNDVMDVERYDEYGWAPEARASNPGPTHLDRAIVRVMPEVASAVASLEAGDIDVLYGVPVQDHERLSSNENFTFQTTPRYGGTLMKVELNHDRVALSDIAVRRALNHAIDREGIAAAIFRNITGEPAYGYLPPHFPSHFPDAKSVGYPYDPETAKQLLDDAGYVVGEDGKRSNGEVTLDSLEFIITTRTDDMLVSQIIQQNLLDIGIGVVIISNTGSAALDLAKAGDFDLYLGAWGWSDPEILNLMFQSSNRSRVNDPDLDEMLTAAAQASTIEERNARYMDADQYLIEIAPWIPVVFQTDLIAIRSSIQGLEFDALGNLTFPTDWSIN